MHPKTEIRPTPAAVDKMLASGWVGQMKIHGHRAQIHISADPDHDPIVYNRQGRPHKKLLPPELATELRRMFDLTEGWTVIDAEWIKDENKLFLFDLLKLNGESLRPRTYHERWSLLPRLHLSPRVRTLPLLTTRERCMAVLARPEKWVEGLVFKSASSKGFSDTAIVRCRKR